MRLLNDRVLVKLAPLPPRPSGVILAEADPLPHTLGKVVAIGPRCKSVQPGAVVIFAPEAFTDDVTGVAGLVTPHVIIREDALDVQLERA